MSNKLMLLPFALLLSPTSSKATNSISTKYTCQSIHKLLQDEELLEGFDTYSLLDFTRLEPARDFKTS